MVKFKKLAASVRQPGRAQQAQRQADEQADDAQDQHVEQIHADQLAAHRAHRAHDADLFDLLASEWPRWC